MSETLLPRSAFLRGAAAVAITSTLNSGMATPRYGQPASSSATASQAQPQTPPQAPATTAVPDLDLASPATTTAPVMATAARAALGLP